MSRKIARITQEKKLLLTNEVVESNAKTSLNSDGRLDVDEIIEYPAELEGGRNLLRNSDFKFGFDVYWNRMNSSPPSNFTITSEGLLKVTKSSDNADFGKLNFISLNNLGDVENLTASAWVKGNGEFTIRFGASSTHIEAVNSDTIKKYVFHIPKNRFGNGNFIISVTSGEIFFDRVKAEIGDKATPWTPAPEDLGLNYPDSIQNFNSSISGNNIIVPEFIEGYPFVKPVIDDSLVLWLDGSTGNNYEQTGTWKDLSGNGNDGQLVNFGYIEGSGWVDGGLRFDGVDDCVDTGKRFTHNDLTLEVTCCLYDVRNIMGSRGGTYWAPNPGIDLYGTSNDLRFHIGDGENLGTVSTKIADILDGIHTITAVKSGNMLYIYIDGMKVAENSTNVEEFTDENKMRIGQRGVSWISYPTKMDLYNFKLYNRALTDEEILQNYQAGQCSPLLAMRGDV